MSTIHPFDPHDAARLPSKSIEELRALAKEAAACTLQPTAVLDELFRRLAERDVECAEWRARWDQLDPQKQAEAMPHIKLLAIVMYLHGIVDVEITTEDIAKMPKGHALIMGEKPERKGVIRLRWMSQKQAQEQLGVNHGRVI